MQIKFCGAAREVTGSCHLLEAQEKKILIDCGMFQGSDFSEKRNYDEFPFKPSEIDVVLITHAHLDHVGRLPKLIQDGFKGKIFMTKATREFARLIWEDAHSIMEYENRKFKKSILYSQEEIDITFSKCIGLDYKKLTEVIPGVKATWKDAGHIFGAAFIEIETEGKRIVFSGDIGNVNVPILKDTEDLGTVDVLVCESTYGDRLHESIGTRRSLILKLLKDATKKNGAIMIPSFSLERTQELLYELNMLSEHDKSLPKMPIFVDSPLAIRATQVYNKYPEYYDVKAKELHEAGDDFFEFPNLMMTLSKDESIQINNVPNPKLIIAGAGMMNGGRILHHALRYLSDPNSTLIIVGYQAEGTLGRRLYEGDKTVKVFNEKVKVNCTVQAIGALSAHGDQHKLLDWIASGPKLPEKVYCIHGEPKAVTELSNRIKEDLHTEAYVPEFGEIVKF